MGNCAALVRGDVPIERVLQTDALDEMIDQRQRAQSLALQDEANHCTCPSQYLALVLATDDKSQPLHRLTRRHNVPLSQSDAAKRHSENCHATATRSYYRAGS